MHELGRAQRVLAEVIRQAKERRVRKVSVQLTSSHMDDGEEFKYLFKANAAQTVAEDSEVEVEFVGSSYECNACGNTEEGLPFDPIRCAKCGSTDLKKKDDFEITGIVFA